MTDFFANNTSSTSAYLGFSAPANYTAPSTTLASLTTGTFYAGGSGYDVVNLDSVARRSGSFAQEADGDVTFTSLGKVDTYRSIEVVNFADGRMVFDAADPAAQVLRLYEAGLDRAPDQGGLNFWIGQLQSGAGSLSSLADSFIASSEFTARFGTNLSNSAFVTEIYDNVLGRGPDQGGLTYWSGQLDSGVGRGQVLSAISESGENQAGTRAMISAGIWDISENAAQVARLYDTALGRLPDVGGLTFWRGSIDAGTATLSNVADAFVGSNEFQATYGTLSNRAFVERVYQNTLDRAGDAGGINFWTGQLDTGVARRDVVIGFSESLEHRALTAPDIMSENPAEFGILFA